MALISVILDAIICTVFKKKIHEFIHIFKYLQ